MSLKTILAAALLAATASAAMAQTTQPNQSTTPPRTTTTPAAPAQAPAPAAQRPATTAPAATAPAPAAAQPARPAAAQSQLVNLNTASKDELDKLPQIGDARAAAIIAKRPYKDWADFVAKGVVPSNAEAAIKDKVRFR